MCIKVDLPLPDAPTSASNSPSATRRGRAVLGAVDAGDLDGEGAGPDSRLSRVSRRPGRTPSRAAASGSATGSGPCAVRPDQCPAGARQRVRPGAGQRADGERQPVEGPSGAARHRPVGRLLPGGGELGLDLEGGGQRHREQRGTQQGAVRVHPQHDEAGHGSPLERLGPLVRGVPAALSTRTRTRGREASERVIGCRGCFQGAVRRVGGSRLVLTGSWRGRVGSGRCDRSLTRRC